MRIGDPGWKKFGSRMEKVGSGSPTLVATLSFVVQAGAGDRCGGGKEALPHLHLIGLRRYGGAPEKTPLLW
jgi:hypothetical protein